jgi:DNA modification methylase
MENLSERQAGAVSKVAFPNPETTTVWSFPVRGAWATHTNKYRGNFAPQLARNVLERYSQAGDLILDPMAGGGTTLIEAKLLGRKFIGADINPAAVEICTKVTDFDGDEEINPKHETRNTKQIRNSNDTNSKQNKILCADARDLSFIASDSIDMILTHPPYLNIVRYSDGIAGDLSGISSVKKFCAEMRLVAGELLRVLKPGHHCALLMGDTRRGRHFVPLAYRVMDTFLDSGFILKEDIIKVQHNCSATGRWVGKARKAGFYLIMHEHLFIFRKADKGEDLGRVKESRNVRTLERVKV